MEGLILRCHLEACFVPLLGRGLLLHVLEWHHDSIIEQVLIRSFKVFKYSSDVYPTGH
jgi:hypothetical protein